jgi:hypothetical protein
VFNQSKKNAIILPSAGAGTCVCDIWVDVMVELYEKHNISTKYFMYFDEGKLKKSAKKIHQVFGDSIYFHDHRLAWKGVGFYKAKKVNVLDSELLKNIAHYELIALKMMDRIDPLGDSFSFSNRQYFFRDLLLTWMNIIDELSIDIAFSPEVPHRVYDYALYVALNIKRKKILTFELTPFGDASIVMDEIDQFPDIYLEVMKGSSVNNVSLVNQKLSDVRKNQNEYKLWYMERQRKMSSVSLLDLLKKNAAWFLTKINDKNLFQKVKFKINDRFQKNISVLELEAGSFPDNSWYGRHWCYWVKCGKMPQDSWFSKHEIKKVLKQRKKTVIGFEKKYRQLVDSSIDLKTTRYVAVGLHYQPELTSCPTGGGFVDQLLIIDMLDKLLPSDVQIFVKEHLAQFRSFTESSSGRSNIFYERLSSFSDRVKFLASDVPSFDFIDNSLAVVTISGTIGFEALARGKPVFVFGRTWYELAPGAFRVRNSTDLVEAYNKISSDSFICDPDKFDQYIKKLSNYFVWGLHSGSYMLVSKRGHEESVQNIVLGLARFLERMR